MAVRKRWNKKGQGTLEYLLILAVVIAAVAAAATAVLRPALDKTLGDTRGAIENAGAKIAEKLK